MCFRVSISPRAPPWYPSRAAPESAGAAALGLRSVNDEGDELLAAIEAAAERTAPPVRVVVTPGASARALRPAVARPDDATVLATLDGHGGSVKATARALGVSRSTIRHRVAKLRPTAVDAAGEVVEGRGGDDWTGAD
jgi:DNA-binding transcriptional LysR family regulator